MPAELGASVALAGMARFQAEDAGNGRSGVPYLVVPVAAGALVVPVVAGALVVPVVAGALVVPVVADGSVVVAAGVKRNVARVAVAYGSDASTPARTAEHAKTTATRRCVRWLGCARRCRPRRRACSPVRTAGRWGS